MSTLSRSPPFKVGERVQMKDTGRPCTVWDTDEVNKVVRVNWVEGPKHEMQTASFLLAGPANTWPLKKAAPAPK